MDTESEQPEAEAKAEAGPSTAAQVAAVEHD